MVALISGIVVFFGGLASLLYGKNLNSDVEMVMKYLFETGKTNPGGTWISLGAILMCVGGIAVLAGLLMKLGVFGGDTRKKLSDTIDLNVDNIRKKLIKSTCPHCSKTLTTPSAFCPYCGKSTRVKPEDPSVSCPSCRKKVPTGVNYCPYCRTSMNNVPTRLCPKCNKPLPKDGICSCSNGWTIPVIE